MDIKKLKKTWARKLTVVGASCGFSLLTVTSAMANVAVSNVPLFLTESVDPNIMFIIDDSGSMHWETTGDLPGVNYIFPRLVNGIYGDDDYVNDVPSPLYDSASELEVATALAYRSSAHNVTYYNPAITYFPWIKADGERFPDADPEAAFHHPFRTGRGFRNLTVELSEEAWWYSIGGVRWTWETRTYYPAFYAHYEGGSRWDADSYEPVEIRLGEGPYTGHGRENRTDCTAGVCTDVQEMQNFANWYTYYRSRLLASQASIGNAFSELSPGARVGFGAINANDRNIDGVDTNGAILSGVRRFDLAGRENFYDNLYENVYGPNGTPLRTALESAGEYFSRTDDRGPWSEDPAMDPGSTKDHAECRQSFSILMTDGFWSNSPDPDVDNSDGTAGATITGPENDDYAYAPTAPFSDGRSEVLADVAMEYWKNDLRPDLANRVPPLEYNGDIEQEPTLSSALSDPAFWQHMVTFGVAFGVTGNVEADSAFRAIETGDSVPWGDTNTDPGKIDDLLHAGVNSRGGFFNASNPEEFADQLADVLDDIVSRVEQSATAAATSSALLRSDSLSFSAGFRSTDWSGALQAFEILPSGATGNLIWDAEFGLSETGADDRNLFTTAAGAGVALDDISDLTATQQAALRTELDGSVDAAAGALRIDWLRGAADDEIADRFRKRTGADTGRLRLLGDIIGSNPVFAGKSNYGHGRLIGTGVADLVIEGTTYLEFRASSTYLARPDVVYVGANDGYLHGFDSLTGEELFAYMPSELLEPTSGGFAPVNRLMDPEYDHRYFLDGSAEVGDAFIDGSWRTILVGSMGAGGKTVFALDISDPENFSASDVLWEFTHEELGQGVETARIVRLESGNWAAVFGNGYNSDSQESSLFVVDLADGSLLDRIETGAGGSASPNGLAAPTVLADPATGMAKSAYAGDLLGNMWRFDLTGNNTNYSQKRLFSATDAVTGGNPQPITSAPALTLNPATEDPGDIVVVFGTGSYFRSGDGTDTQTQSLYGIFDDGTGQNIDKDDLLPQTITDEFAQLFGGETQEVRTVSGDPMESGKEGWFIDLSVGTGERVISSPGFPSGFPLSRVRFSTLVPNPDPCSSGRQGFLMDVKVATGGATDELIFDLNGDGQFDINDSSDGDSATAGAVIDPNDANAPKVISGVRGITSGEQVSVTLDNFNRTDIFIDSIIVELPESYSGPVRLSTPEERAAQDEANDDGGPANPTSLVPGYNLGRQHWEELR
jgi:type IV pilus assembly protein PilY1